MGSRLIVGELLTEREAAALVAEVDRMRAAAFPEARRRAYLSWRALLTRELGYVPEIVYEPSGAPRLAGFAGYISVSHSRTHAAVCISEAQCGVDIEFVGRDFACVQARYMTSGERALSPDPLLPAAVWCAKECMYKYARRSGTDRLRDLRVDAVDFAAGRIAGRVGREPVAMRMHRYGEDLAVWTE